MGSSRWAIARIKRLTIAALNFCVVSSLVWFEVPVHDAIVVEILQSQYCLCKVHPGHIHRQRTHVLQKSGTVSTCKDQWSGCYRTQGTRSKCTAFKLQHYADLRHIPWPCTGVAASQRSSTWTPQRGSQQRWGCLSPRRPAVSDSLKSGSVCWSFSWRNAASFPCAEPGKQLCGINSLLVKPVLLMTSSGNGGSLLGGRQQHLIRKYDGRTRRRRCWWVLSSRSPIHRVYAATAGLCWGSETERQIIKQITKIKSVTSLAHLRVKDGADRYSNQFQSAYGVIRFWGFCNAAITAGQLSNFYREKQEIDLTSYEACGRVVQCSFCILNAETHKNKKQQTLAFIHQRCLSCAADSKIIWIENKWGGNQMWQQHKHLRLAPILKITAPEQALIIKPPCVFYVFLACNHAKVHVCDFTGGCLSCPQTVCKHISTAI